MNFFKEILDGEKYLTTHIGFEEDIKKWMIGFYSYDIPLIFRAFLSPPPLIAWLILIKLNFFKLMMHFLYDNVLIKPG